MATDMPSDGKMTTTNTVDIRCTGVNGQPVVELFTQSQVDNLIAKARCEDAGTIGFLTGCLEGLLWHFEAGSLGRQRTEEALGKVRLKLKARDD